MPIGERLALSVWISRGFADGKRKDFGAQEREDALSCGAVG